MTSPGREPLRRDDVVSGSIQSQRRAARVLGTIEARVLHMRGETRRAFDSYFFGEPSDYRRKVDRGYLASVLTRIKADDDVSVGDLERFANHWRSLVPADPRTRADLIHRLVDRFGDGLAAAPATLESLGAQAAEVREEYRAAFGGDLPSTDSVAPRPDASIRPDERAEWRRVRGGEAVYEDGDSPEALYLVVNGHLRLFGGEEGTTESEWEYTRGAVAGEAEVLTGEPRMGRLVALRDTELICVPKEAVLDLASQKPETLFRMNRALVDRLRGRRSRTGASRAAHTFALVPAHSGAPLAEVARDLTRALGALGSTTLIDRAALEAQLPEEASFDVEAFEAEVIGWLSEQETQHQFVVAEAGSDPESEWSQRCRRQADRIVFVADAESAPQQAFLRQATSIVQPDLLLVHAAETERPRNTRLWMKAVNPRFVYHWRRGDEAQTAHIARRLTGKAVAVVLSGGAARGYAHIGAMHALAERGIPIDLIAGTSMGAMVGGGFALGKDAEAMRHHALATASRRKLLDPTLPLSAFTAGGKVTRLLKHQTEGERIEDLWRPFFCVSSNLTKAREQVHASGPLWHAIRASVAIPGVIPPVLSRDGDVLVDGASINNMPIDIARQREDIATVIAVNVAPSRDRTESYRFGPTLSGWATLLRQLTRFGQSETPGIFSTVMRANEIRGAALMRSPAFTGLADLIIEPPVAEFPLLQFSQCRSIIECGYESAAPALDVWLGESHLLESLGLVRQQ